ncbi:MAG: hypothetical protein HOI95_23840, partial [Chromatiales bacterium]|nr:hypothetical protein [Chromatiales bacterium]
MDDRRGDFAELQTARALVPSIVAERDVIAANQELPIELTESLTGNGLFRMLLPEFLDGPQLPLTKFIRCVEVIAEADGSTGWCVGQGGVFANLADRMPRETADEIWGANPGAVVATGTPFGSTARATANGYELSGRWRFASGCTHASWFGAMANVVDSEGKVVGFGMFMVSRADINLGGGWNVNGLRGTGSREYTLSGHQVPAARAMLGAVLREHCGVATGLPAQLIFASGFGSVGLGIARHALDSLIDLIHGKTPTFSSRKMLDDDMVHVALA